MDTTYCDHFETKNILYKHETEKIRKKKDVEFIPNYGGRESKAVERVWG